MKTTRQAPGRYLIALHGHTFILERLYGARNWTLYNDKGVEINQAETKSGLLTVMSNWSYQRTGEYATQESCTYA
jgi:hypothetical protein